MSHVVDFSLQADETPCTILAVGSTPTSTQPQQGMNINTPPTQLSSGVGLGDSGRGKEEAPLVADDVAMDEDEDDDGAAEQYVYNGASSGFERHESVLELPPPEAQRIIDDLPGKKPRERARKGRKLIL